MLGQQNFLQNIYFTLPCCRFYDLNSGELTVEGKDIRSLNLPLVRSALGIVSQVYL